MIIEYMKMSNKLLVLYEERNGEIYAIISARIKGSEEEKELVAKVERGEVDRTYTYIKK